MKRNFLPPLIGIAMTKSQFSFCTGCSPYRLRQILTQAYDRYHKLGYNKWDKLLMPNVVLQLLEDTGLQIDVDLYMQYVAGQRGQYSQVEG